MKFANRKSRNNLIISMIVLILISLTVMILIKLQNNNKNVFLIFTYLCNGIIWLFLFVHEVRKRAYSLIMMQWLFCIFFFELAPLIQYIVGYFPWINTRSENVLLRANLLLTIWTVAVQGGIFLGKYGKRNHGKYIYRQWKGYSTFLPLLTLFCFFNLMIRIVTIGPVNMLFRSTNTGVSMSSNGSVSMLISRTTEALVYFTAILSLVKYRQNRKVIIWALLNCTILLFSYFPTGMARFAVAVLYLGAMLTYFTKFRADRNFILLFIGAFTIILPFFSAFRIESGSLNLGVIMREVLINLVENWLKFDYDAYTLFTLTLEHVDEFGTGRGIHIISDLLFWVPRSLWHGKAYSGSYEIAHVRHLFDNLSFPFPALGYIDGGGIGLFAVGLIIGIIMKKFDDSYWEKLDVYGNTFRPIDVLYPAVMIYWFFMCRGDIFYILAYLTCYLVAWYLIVILVKNGRMYAGSNVKTFIKNSVKEESDAI